MDANTGLQKSIAVAQRFLDRLASLSETDRAKIHRDAFGNPKHTGAMMMMADEITTLRNKDKEERLSAFLVDAEQRLAGLKLDRELDGLAKAAVRALILEHLPGREAATKDLYAPLEAVIPRASLG